MEMTQLDDHVAIEIRTDDPLALIIKNKLDKVPFQLVNTDRPYTIFRVPSYIRECNKNFYEPRIVSIGPYHRDREHLKCMEEQKLCSILALFLHDPNVPLMLENQIPFFVLKTVFDLYSSIDNTSSSFTPSNFDSSSQESEPPKASLPYLLATFLQPGNETLPLPEADHDFEHLLDFYYHSYMSSQKLPVKMKKLLPLKLLRPRNVFPLISSSIKRITLRRRLKIFAKRKPRMVPCATELKDVGITFKKAESKSIFDVNFSNGVLRIPYTSVEEATRPRLMNLIAFEQCSGQKEKPLTSYAVFMDCIVNTPRDVLILQQHEIIENKLADEKAAAEFFNQLRYCSYLDYEDHHLAKLFKKVKKYCDSRLHKYRAHFYRDYFSNPWSIISFLAAIVFLFLSTVQTLYSILSYYRSLNSN